jgi:hypothetical protein
VSRPLPLLGAAPLLTAGLVGLVGLILALAACTSATPGPPAPAAPPPPTADGGITPLVISALAPDPIPVRGSDDRVHVSYELQVLNTAPKDATITRVETLAEDGRVLATVASPEVVARSLIVGDYQLPPVPAATVPAGRTVLLILDDVYADRAAVPAAVTHRVEARFAPPATAQAEFAGNFPEHAEQVGGVVRTGAGEPVVIGPPMNGTGWWAVNACCELSAHRGAMIALGGRINGAERYAIDWLQVDFAITPFADPVAGLPLASARGDRTRNESYLAYGEPLLAVADATVVAVVSGMPDAPPGTVLPGLTVAQLGGNHVTLQLGPGRYAFYAHLKPGSATVRVGDRVTRGQEIGRLGNSGNTTQPHLHFHLMNSPQPLTGVNLPFEIDRFELQGTVDQNGLVAGSPRGPRTDALPLISTAITLGRTR